jgi:predicted SprT family Zn-dependent metalloprotease
VTTSVDRYRVSPPTTDEELLAVCRLYARDVVVRHDLTVEVTALDWEVSTRAKRRAGAVVHRDGTPISVRLTREYFESEGWDALAATIRHELIHVHLLNEQGDASHGEAFRTWAERLATDVRCERFADPRWIVECVDCGRQIHRYRRSKLVSSPAQFECGACGGRLASRRAAESESTQ